MSEAQHRKRSHIDICTHRDVSFQKSTLLEEDELIHCALPEFDLNDITLRTQVAGISLSAPFLIGAMTGGTGDGCNFNFHLADAAAEHGVALCLGSIRPALANAALLPEFQVKKAHPKLPVFANIGANQLRTFTANQILDASRELADGLMIHLNAGMELIQPNGDTCFSGQLDAIANLVDTAEKYPVIVKETGMGLSVGDGHNLMKAGISIVETAGAGGTSWIGVETERATGVDKAVGQMLWNFGIPTAVSVIWMKQLGLQTIASGGVYSSLDAARAIRLGADAVALARPFLLAYQNDKANGVSNLLNELITGLKYVMLCVGVQSLPDLQSTPCVVGPRLQHYVDAPFQENV